jgi:hypothetical protein
VRTWQNGGANERREEKEQNTGKGVTKRSKTRVKRSKTRDTYAKNITIAHCWAKIKK